MKEVLKVDKINKYFGKKHVVKDLSFTMNEGDILEIDSFDELCSIDETYLNWGK